MMCTDIDDFSDLLRDVDQREDVTVTIWQGMSDRPLGGHTTDNSSYSYWQALLGVSAVGVLCFDFTLHALSSAVSISGKL